MNIPFAPSTLILALALVILFGAIVAIPLLDRKRPAVDRPSPLDVLELERATIVRNVRELDFDQRTGKIYDADYLALRTHQVERGAHILREIAALRSAETGHDHVFAEHEIEEQVARLRARATRTCARCTAVLRQDDKFCSQCGEKVKP